MTKIIFQLEFSLKYSVINIKTIVKHFSIPILSQNMRYPHLSYCFYNLSFNILCSHKLENPL